MMALCTGTYLSNMSVIFVRLKALNSRKRAMR